MQDGRINASALKRFDPLIGTVHRVKNVGPIYKVLGIRDEETADVLLVETGRQARFKIDDVLLDPDPESEVVEDFGILPKFSAQDLVGQIRRIGYYGPAYEIMSIDGDKVNIEVIESEEKVALPISEVVRDPMAETIP